MSLSASIMAAMAMAISVTPAPITKPDVIEFGASVDAMQRALKSSCTEKKLRSFDPPSIPIARKSHQQIDCQGFDFMGEPRLAEFVFVDDRLQLVWILVDEDDQQRIIDAMRQTYKSDGLVNEMAIAFPKHRTAWRFKPAEVLFYSEDVAPMFEARFGNSGSD